MNRIVMVVISRVGRYEKRCMTSGGRDMEVNAGEEVRCV